MKNKLTNILILSCLTFLGLACTEDDSPVPITVNLTNSEVAISSTSTSTEVEITFSRATSNDGEIQLVIESGNLDYGSEADFYTNPEAITNTITLPYFEGDESVNFTVFAGSTLNIQEEKIATISLLQASDGLLIGDNVSITVTFSENYIAPSGTLTLDAGGSAFPLQSFADLSKLKQTTKDKYSWDIGLHTTAGEHSVVINSGAFTMARAIDKNDLTQVTAEDTLGFSYEMQIPPPNFDPSIGAMAWVDTPDGNLSTTAFGTIHTTDEENRVFIVKREGDRDWQKVRVLKNNDNYTIQYADISETAFETAQITKNENYNFSFFDFDKGEVNFEPNKNSWDIMYGTYTESINLGGPGMDIPYGFSDYIIINRYNTKVATVMNETRAYDEFSTEDIVNVDFQTEIDALGENWRMGGGPSSQPALYEDRYFILEDSEGSIFKIKFTSLSVKAERGHPEFIFEKI